jgi:hypothetical protein
MNLDCHVHTVDATTYTVDATADAGDGARGHAERDGGEASDRLCQRWLPVPYRTVPCVSDPSTVVYGYGGLRTLTPVRYANCAVR